MKLIAQLKLLPTAEQADALCATLETANAACNHVSRVAWGSGTFREYALRKLVYADLRATYGLGAQIAQHCVAKVADAYARDRTAQRTFMPYGSIAFDDRNLSYALPDASVSLWTVWGRQRIPFACGERQWQLLQTRQIDKRNRPCQAVFSCVRCGFAGHADTIAAENIRRGAVSRPDCSDLPTGESARAKPTALRRG